MICVKSRAFALNSVRLGLNSLRKISSKPQQEPRVAPKISEPLSTGGEKPDKNPSSSDHDETASTLQVPELPFLVKGITLFTLGYLTYNAIPVMGDSLVEQSVRLCKSKDPFFQRSGASRINRIATDDKTREKVVGAGGIEALVRIISSSNDEDTIKEALNALENLTQNQSAVSATCALGAETPLYRLVSVSLDSAVQKNGEKVLSRMSQWTEQTYTARQ